MGADLRGANLREADLFGADLQEANLRGADLQEADLNGVDFHKAKLEEANLCKAKNLSLDQLSRVKTLRNAKLDEELLIPLQEKYPPIFL
jgi:BTB/POZ domain-containing protein KCTD9